MRYDPNRNPDAEAWLALSEDERLSAVLDYHQNCDDPLPESGDWSLHSHLHVIVENQLAMDDPPAVRQALERLSREGLSRHDAIHAVAALMAERIHSILNEESSQSEWLDYERSLGALSADALVEEQDFDPPHADYDLEDRERALTGSTQPVRSKKVGRNQPCPCGSGKKFKKCCGRP